jgi:hypothetical protein
MYLTFKYLISVVKYTQSDLVCKEKRNFLMLSTYFEYL